MARAIGPNSGYDFDTVSSDLEGLLAAIRHPEPVVVVGHSWGATVALAFAANHPELALGVVCIDGGAGDLKAYFGPELGDGRARPCAPGAEGRDAGDVARVDGLVAAARRV